MKIYVSCVPAQIPYLGKFWFLRYGPKCSQLIRLQDFLHVDTNSRKLIVDQLSFGCAWTEMGLVSLVIGL